MALQGAGATGHRSHPEHGLGLVDDFDHPLRLQGQSGQGLLQGGHDFGLLDVEGQGDGLLLGREKTGKGPVNDWSAPRGEAQEGRETLWSLSFTVSRLGRKEGRRK